MNLLIYITRYIIFHIWKMVIKIFSKFILLSYVYSHVILWSNFSIQRKNWATESMHIKEALTTYQFSWCQHSARGEIWAWSLLYPCYKGVGIPRHELKCIFYFRGLRDITMHPLNPWPYFFWVQIGKARARWSFNYPSGIEFIER